jgi:hypothetical protein
MRANSVLALRAGEDIRAAALRLGRARETFIASHLLASCVRPVVAHSWQRCAVAGVSFDGRRLPVRRIYDGELADYRARHPLAVLMPLFGELLGERADDGEYVYAVTDAQGTLLWVQGHRETLRRAERMNFAEGAGWAEAEAGTNAPGTALAVEEPVQVFAAEHYNSVMHPWSCSAAPVRDPDSGRVLGTVDITGGDNIANPHTLALVRATARAAEAELALRVRVTDAQARQEYADRVGSSQAAVVLVSPGGRLLAGTAAGRDRFAEVAAEAEARPDKPDGDGLLAEPVGPAGHMLIRFAGAGRALAPASVVRLTALGRDCALLELDGRVLRLRPRHSEIVVLLALAMEGAGEAGGGISGPRLAVELSEEEIHPVTLRAEMSRLRTLLGGELLGSQPYMLRRTVRADFAAVLDLVAEGRVDAAVGAYSGPLLPNSEAPAIAEYRTALEQQLRAEVLASADAGVLRRWVAAPWGAADAEAWAALAQQLPGGSPQRAAAMVRAGGVLAPVR